MTISKLFLSSINRIRIYEKVLIVCKHICLQDNMIQVQVRVPENLLEMVDKWIEEGRFKSRSDAIRIVLSQYEEREKTREFYKLLNKRSREAKEHPEELVPLE